MPMYFFRRPWFVGSLLLIGGLLAGCGSDAGSSAATHPTDTINAETKGDSVALRLLTAHGADALASAPYLRFNFSVATPEGEQVIGRHFWNRSTGDYRVEWQSGPDSNYVALIDVDDVENQLPPGSVYLNGTELKGEAAEEARQQAYGRYINDTYWLLAPLKVFDPGVSRTYVADSSTADHEVLHLTFGDVGLTPGDEYWFYVSKETGRLDRWAMRLQNMPEDATPQAYSWGDYTTLETSTGSVTLATRHEAVGADQAVLTNELALPSQPPEGAFSNPGPMLGTSE